MHTKKSFSDQIFMRNSNTQSSTRSKFVRSKIYNMRQQKGETRVKQSQVNHARMENVSFEQDEFPCGITISHVVRQLATQI